MGGMDNDTLTTEDVSLGSTNPHFASYVLKAGKGWVYYPFAVHFIQKAIEPKVGVYQMERENVLP